MYVIFRRNLPIIHLDVGMHMANEYYEIPDRSFQILDLTQALERVGGDRELLGEIAALFLEDAPDLLRRMREALSKGDAYRLERSAHALKGSVSNFGAKRVYDAALALEMDARKQELVAAPAHFEMLEKSLNALQPELAAVVKP